MQPSLRRCRENTTRVHVNLHPHLLVHGGEVPSVVRRWEAVFQPGRELENWLTHFFLHPPLHIVLQNPPGQGCRDSCINCIPRQLHRVYVQMARLAPRTRQQGYFHQWGKLSGGVRMYRVGGLQGRRYWPWGIVMWYQATHRCINRISPRQR